jgi:hypothetical protein
MTNRWQGRNRTAEKGNKYFWDDVRPWDYWRASTCTEPDTSGNLTGLHYWVVIPNRKDGSEPGHKVARLTLHTVREHDDNTISVKHGDGSSNSILVHGTDFHGWIDHGVFHEQGSGQ